MLSFEEYKALAFEAATKKGCSAAEVYFTDGEQFSANVLGGQLDEYSVEHSFGLNLRVQFDGKDGYAYTEVLDDPEALVERAVDNARSSESPDVHPMQGKCEYEKVAPPETKVIKMSPAEKIAYAAELEKQFLASDPRAKRAQYSAIQTAKNTVRLHNTLGLEADTTRESAFAILGTILEQDGVLRDAFVVKEGDELLDKDAMIKEGIEKTVEQFGASPVPSGEYRVMIRNEAMASMLAAFSSMFSADSAQKGLSLLAGMEGKAIAAECVTLMDDPFYAENPRAFDAEGVPSVTKKVIENGVLTTLLHNLKTAAKAGVASTSNAGRSASGPVGVSPSNFFIKKGEASYEEMIKKLENGLIITDVSGLHAGLNPVSGDFSLIAKGLLVKDGEIVRSVDQITVAGNFITMMKAVTAVGADLKFGMPMGARVGSPSVIVEKLMVSGS
ncbi:MAG: TldD/PmbA family protein [Clostridiales bacterium]|nr:TldD/PmbA family protein [Clostridiales bacterium]